MILFKKHKLKKLLAQYEAEYKRVIPENAIAYDELLALKDLNLEEIAATYDALEGYKYFVESLDGIDTNLAHHIPDKSKCFPSVVSARGTRKHYLARSLKKLRMQRFKNKDDFNEYPEVSHNKYKYIEESGGCWKSMIG